MLIKTYRIILLLGLVFVSSCLHAPLPYAPLNLMSTQIEPQALEDDAEQARLNVLVIYGTSACAHTALRLHSPGRGALFWDPAGSYGTKGSAKARRQKDLVFDDTPTLSDYLFFRREIPTSAVEIFEWLIPTKKADELHDILLLGADRSNGKGKFSSRGYGLFCGSKVSDFLHRFAEDIITVQNAFFPHNLAKQLYAQSPDRVIIIKGKDLKTYLILRPYNKVGALFDR